MILGILPNNIERSMKKLSILFLVFLFLMSMTPVSAGYSSTAYGGTSDSTFFSRTSDWFATLGKSQKEKYRIKHERWAARKIKKAKKRINKQKRDFARQRKASKK